MTLAEATGMSRFIPAYIPTAIAPKLRRLLANRQDRFGTTGAERPSSVIDPPVRSASPER
jgi:hypothetical protein